MATMTMQPMHSQQQQFGHFAHRPLQPTLVRQNSQPLYLQPATQSQSQPMSPLPLYQSMHQQPLRPAAVTRHQQAYLHQSVSLPTTPQQMARHQHLHQQQQQPQQSPQLQQQQSVFPLTPQPQPRNQQPHQHQSQQLLLQRHVSTPALFQQQPQLMQHMSQPGSPMIGLASQSSASTSQSSLSASSSFVHDFNPFRQEPALQVAAPAPLIYGSHQLPLQAHRLQHQQSQPVFSSYHNSPAPQPRQQPHQPQPQLLHQHSMPQMDALRRMSRSEPATPVQLRHAHLRQQQAEQLAAQHQQAASQLEREMEESALALAVDTQPKQADAAPTQAGPNDEFGPAVPRVSASRMAGKRLRRRVTRGIEATFKALAQLDEPIEPDTDEAEEGEVGYTRSIKYVDGREDENETAALAKASLEAQNRQLILLQRSGSSSGILSRTASGNIPTAAAPAGHVDAHASDEEVDLLGNLSLQTSDF